MIATLRRLARCCVAVALVHSRSCSPPAAAQQERRLGDGGSPAGTLERRRARSFQKTFDEAAIRRSRRRTPDVTVNYAGGGSGKGKTDLQTKTVDFAGTDSLLKPEDLAQVPGRHAPLLPDRRGADHGVVQPARRRQAAARAATRSPRSSRGKIKKWNDAAIAADNPGVDAAVDRHHGRAPRRRFGHDEQLHQVPRGRGPTRLDARQRRHRQLAVDSQAGTAATRGVAQIVRQTDGAIGYVDFADADGREAADSRRSRTRPASSSRRRSTAPRPPSRAPTVNADLTYNPLNAPGADAYPITSPTWIIVYKNADRQADRAPR